MRQFYGLLCAILMITSATPLYAQDATRQISVTGVGEVSAAPDMATISIGVIGQAETAAEAMQSVSDQMAAMFDVLDEYAITGADRQTQGLNLGPIWDSQSRNQIDPIGPQIIGYRADNTLSIRVIDLPVLGAVLDGLTRAGANQINNISFGLMDTSELMIEARRLAVLDGAARADLYVTTAGATLGKIISIDETGSGGGRPMAMEMAMSRMADSVPVAEGEVSLRAELRMVYAID